MASERDAGRPFDRVIVVGGGAIGSLYAAKLASHCEVTIVARPAHVEAIERDGLRVVGAETFTARVRAIETMDAIERVPEHTLVLLTTKVNDNRSATAAIAHALATDTVILCVQNGLGGEAIVKAELSDRGRGDVVVLRAVTQFGAIFQEAGVVDYKVAGHTLIERGGPSTAIAATLSACGLDGRVSDVIATDVWRKLIFNCVINPITSIAGVEVGGIADPRLDRLKALVIDECLAVARADGVVFSIDFMSALTEIFGPSRNIASMRQDLMKGKPTEIDHMNGAVVALGARHGIACPVNAALTAIIKAMEGSARKGKISAP